MIHRGAVVLVAGLIALSGCSRSVEPSRTSTVAGVVRHPGGAPASGAMVSLTTEFLVGGVYMTTIATAGSGGSFSFSGLDPGRYVLSARAEPPNPNVAALRISLGIVDPTEVVLDLEPPGAVVGAALLSDASDHSGIFVSAHGLFGLTSTDAGGAYRLDGVPSGTWRIVAERPSYTSADVDVTLPNPGATVDAPDLVLQPEP